MENIPEGLFILSEITFQASVYFSIFQTLFKTLLFKSLLKMICLLHIFLKLITSLDIRFFFKTTLYIAYLS